MTTSSSHLPNSRKAFSIKLAPLKEGPASTEQKPISSTSATTSTSSRPPLGSVANNNDRHSSDHASLKHSSSFTLSEKGEGPAHYSRSEQSKVSQRGLLRYGERLEDLFGIPSTVPWDDAYYQKCRRLQSLEENGPSNQEERCRLWLGILQDARRQSTLTGSSLVRLHRRATSRLPWDKESQSPLLLEVWLFYVRVQMRQSSFSDAQLTLRHLRAQKHSAYHMAVVELDEKMGKSKAEIIKTLQSAVTQGAEPVELIQRALEDHGATAVVSSVPTFLDGKRPHHANEQQSPKRIKTEASLTRQTPNDEHSITVTETNGLDDSNMSLDDDEEDDNSDTVKWKTTANKEDPAPERQAIHRRDNIDLELRHFGYISRRTQWEQDKAADNLVENKGTSDRHNMAGTPSNISSNRKPFSETSKNLPLRSSGSKQTPKRSGPALSSLPNSHSVLPRHRHPLIGKIPRLAKLSGKAQRADPSQSMLLGDHDDSIDESQASSAVRSATSSAKKSKPSMSKMDLSYIFEWDPDKRLNERKVSVEQPAASLSLTTESTPSHHSQEGRLKDDEKHKGTPLVKETPEDAAVKKASPEDREQKTYANDESSNPNPTLPYKAPASVACASTPGASVAGVSPDFLPLVNERNILRVNGVPFAKLGVIGKGGSCKVYRALSKDCTVVAIKKVKTGGLDQKHIESYANEIKLLKSLRGNPAIIQMFDSQVDFKRKAILMVMEVGEIDLNHVLQQQSLLVDNPEGRKRLNMNFVRLTWFQMLTAVHCIHEQRIIHGDLKPANFLFVRGALKLIDFGIAKTMQTDDTTNIYRENQVGTLNYMCPESFQENEDPDKPKVKLGRVSTCLQPVWPS